MWPPITITITITGSIWKDYYYYYYYYYYSGILRSLLLLLLLLLRKSFITITITITISNSLATLHEMHPTFSQLSDRQIRQQAQGESVWWLPMAILIFL